MKRLSNHSIEGSRVRPILMDIYWPDSVEEMPLVLFAHGYKGFKDWGPWHLMAQRFCDAGMAFVSFNFSFNGGTKENPIDFPDTEAFSENNYSTEVNDLGMMLNWIESSHILPKDRMSGDIYLIGHSRGGGMAVLRTAEDKRVRKLATWAAISDIAKRWPGRDELNEWKKAGIRYVKNSRTGQDLPHRYQFYRDWLDNKDRLDIASAAAKIEVPWLIVHGDEDESVLKKEGDSLARKSNNAAKFIVAGANHTFDGKHPWTHDELPAHLSEVVDKTVAFFKS